MAGNLKAEFRVIESFGVSEDGEAVVAVGLDVAGGGEGSVDVFGNLDGVALKGAV